MVHLIVESVAQAIPTHGLTLQLVTPEHKSLIFRVPQYSAMIFQDQQDNYLRQELVSM